MATVVNNPPAGSNNGFGFLLGVLVLLVVIALFFIYGLPRIIPQYFGGVQVNVPKSVDVHVSK